MLRFDPNPYLTDKDFVLKRTKLCAKILNEPTPPRARTLVVVGP